MNEAMNSTTNDVNTTFDINFSKQTWEILLAYNLYLGFSMVVGLLGNLLVLVVYIKTGTRNNTDWFLIFITIYDFVSSSLNVPVYITFTTGFWRQYGNDVICKIHMVFSQSTVLSAAILIGGMAMERYFKVCRPSTRITKVFSRNICIALSATTFALSLPVIPFYDNSSGLCRKVKVGLFQQLHLIYYTAVVLVFAVLFCVVIFSYSSIAIAVLRSRANIERHSSLNGDNVSEIKCIQCFALLCCGYQGNRTNDISRRENIAVVDTRSRYQAKAPHLTVYTLPESSVSGVIDDSLGGSSGSRSALVVNKSADKMTKVRRSLRTTRLTFVVCLIFVISWIPPWAWFATSYFVTPQTIPYSTYLTLRLFCPMTFLINTFSNPFLYIALNESFRKKVKNLFMCKN